MDHPQAKPGRRRWLIAGLLLALVVLGTWWYRPRGDQRFVGKWKVLEVSDAGNEEPWVIVQEYLPNGSSRDWFNGKLEDTRGEWRVEKDEFVYVWRGVFEWKSLQPLIQDLVDELTGKRRIEVRHRILSVSPNEIRVRRFGHRTFADNLLILTRIPE